MPKLDDITGKHLLTFSVPSLPWLEKAVSPGLVGGGIYLITGEPGAGKSTLAIQVAGDLATQGIKVLYIATEQSLDDVKQAILRIHGSPNGMLSRSIRDNFYLDDSLEDVDRLPDFLARRVVAGSRVYHDVQAIIVDSIQGKGLPSTAARKFRALYEFCETAKARGLLTILIGHVTKKGQIAGPRTLEHNVDCVVYLRRAFNLRPCFVPKNRFGPDSFDPMVLMMDEQGRLVKSPHATAKSSIVLGFAGDGNELSEGQAAISLPRYGSRPELNAPYLPGKKIKQLLRVLSTLDGVDLTNLSYEINCYVPGQQRYRQELDLSLAVALLSSYLQQAVPEKTLFVGELDLTRRVRSPGRAYLAALACLVSDNQWGAIGRIYISEASVEVLARMRPTPNGPPIRELVNIHGVGDLEELLRDLWPFTFNPAKEHQHGRFSLS